MKKLLLLSLIIILLSFQAVYAEEINKNQESTPQVVTEKNVEINTQDIPDAITKQADFVYTYVPNQIFKVYCTETRITDIQLQPGEKILYIGGPDTVRWIIDQAVSGTGATEQIHILVKPLKADISSNLFISTDKHTYHFELFSKTWSTPIINFAYPHEEKLAFLRQQKSENQYQESMIALGDQDGLTLDNMNYGYKIDGRNYPWKPLMVFDDGSKTYIKMPKAMESSEAPALFIKNGKELALVNYRVKNNWYIVDRLFEKAELRNGKEVIKLSKN